MNSTIEAFIESTARAIRKLSPFVSFSYELSDLETEEYSVVIGTRSAALTDIETSLCVAVSPNSLRVVKYPVAYKAPVQSLNTEQISDTKLLTLFLIYKAFFSDTSFYEFLQKILGLYEASILAFVVYICEVNGFFYQLTGTDLLIKDVGVFKFDAEAFTFSPNDTDPVEFSCLDELSYVSNALSTIVGGIDETVFFYEELDLMEDEALGSELEGFDEESDDSNDDGFGGDDGFDLGSDASSGESTGSEEPLTEEGV